MEDSMSVGEELLAEADEPPDDQQQHTPRPAPSQLCVVDSSKFGKTKPPPCTRKESLLTQALHSGSESMSDDDMEHSIELKRGYSTSTWSSMSIASTADLTSDGGLTSPGTRTNSPSPPPPATIHGLPSLFSRKPSEQTITIHGTDHHVNMDPNIKKPANENAVEAGLGRKRCITFACGKKDPAAKETSSTRPVEQTHAEPPKRQCTIKFACFTKETVTAAPKKPRMSSPPPPTRKLSVPKTSPRSHRGSDSTVRQDSPKTVRKIPSAIRSRKYSADSDIGRREATRFHEFASSEEEIEEWVQESTCHRSRLTVDDTLKVEQGLRKLAEEVEEEALEEDDEDDELDEDEDEDEDDDDEDQDGDGEDDEDEEDSHSIASAEVSDGGFQTDDEEGFAVSDGESDAGSDYAWWAPGRSVGASSSEPPEHIRPVAGHRTLSDSSVGSVESGSVQMFSTRKSKSGKKTRKAVDIRPRTPDLPDSTDFVCGTLDEDRPLEEAYITCMEQRRAARHKAIPQDIDPTFPTSDPELEEDEDDEPENLVDESDQHMLIHGQLDHIDETEGRGRRQASKRSPIPSPKRLRSPPPPTKRVPSHRSPPPRRQHGQSPRRLRSPPPTGRLRSPPAPHQGQSMASKHPVSNVQFLGVTQRPPLTHASSLPRPSVVFGQNRAYEEDEDDVPPEVFKRGPMDIKAGTELKRQRRKEKLYQKHCRKAASKEKERRPACSKGKGAERMKEIGMGLAAYKGKKAEPVIVFSY
ncbi:hypothetical protein K490DRAFT_73621 [Saccharata proteae CBS 121410]|uniref:Uncharacterized protein n=1 Tax=Saccharata proteae CBS 121410 TaxID=1314787 RepID=A0A9P4HTG6_9PEZI|nr:hypothetical protein K490DRAFT_73621 [Saccharata proteae CBS 121410]